MALGILKGRRARQQARIDEAVAKALSPAVAAAGANGGGYVQSGTLPSRPVSQAGLSVLTALPRPPAQFGSAFGPGIPLLPEPLDSPDPVTGRVPPRRGEYPVSWNLQLVDRQIPWTVLRRVAENCDVVNRAIQLKQDEVVGYDWGWGFSPQLLAQIKAETGESSSGAAWALARDKYGDELLRVQQFWENPDPDMNQDFASWLQALLWDHFVYDGIAVYPRHNLGGALRAFELVDASTIKLLRDDRGRVPLPPAPAYQQVLYGFPRGEYQHTPGDADDDYQADQLAYFIRRPRNSTIYGFPQVEEVLPLAAVYLERQRWLQAEYSHGVTPRMIVNVKDQGAWTPEQWGIYEQAFNDRLAGQTQRRQMAFFMREGAEAQWAPQKDEHYKVDYDNFLISQMGSRFGIAATQLGVQAKAGLSGGKQMEGEASQVEQFSTKALITFVINLLNALTRRHLGVGTEVTAMCTGGQDEDALNEVTADVALVSGGIMLRAEARNKRGLSPLNVPEADQLAVTTAQGVTFLAGTFEAQQEAISNGATPGTATTDPSHNGQPPVPGDTTGDKTADKTAPGTPKPQASTPGTTDTEATKELAAFRAFAGARLAKSRAWRDFQFRAVDPAVARDLNDAAKSGDPAALEEALTKAKGGGAGPKSLTARKADEAQVAAFYAPKLASALTKGQLQIAAIMTALVADAWVVGNHHAAAAVGAGNDLAPVAWDDWQPGWGETSSVGAETPAELAELLAGSTALASSLQSSKTVAAADAPDSTVNLTSYANDVASTQTALGAEQAAQATYQAAGAQWRWVADAGECALCAGFAAGGPYGPEDPYPPAHPNCGCESEPAEGS